MSSTAGAFSRLELPPIQRQLTAAAWWTGLSLLVAVALVFAARRLAGGLTEPLGGLVLVAVASVLTIAGALLRRWVPGTKYSVLSTAVRFIPGIAAILLLAALTLPGTSPWAAAIAWFVVAAAELLAWTRGTGRRLPRARPLPRSVARHDASDEATDEAIDEAISPALVQSLTRERTADGEALHALVRATCEPGDRVAVVHLAFCPPLVAPPELTAHVLDESGAQAQITLAQPFGARIEVRLPRPASPGQQVLLEVLGSASPPKGT
jgi:hypothetical protein